jgi:hypothetical protein
MSKALQIPLGPILLGYILPERASLEPGIMSYTSCLQTLKAYSFKGCEISKQLCSYVDWRKGE